MTTHVKRFFSTLISDNAEKSLLSKDESLALKGFLMLLIVLGHDKYLHRDGWSYQFLYSFHVYAFYYLPFLYDFKYKLIMPYVATLSRQLLVPFVMCFALLLVVSHTSGAYSLNVGKILQSLWTGDVRASLNTGGFLWFIPTYFSLMLWRQLFYRMPIWGRIVLLVASSYSLFCWSFGWWIEIRGWIPMLGFTALAMLLPAVLCRCFVLQKSVIQWAPLLFFVLVFIKMIVYPSDYSTAYTVLNRIVSPVIIFLFIISIRSLFVSFSWIGKIGKVSFPVYLIHVFLYNAAYLCLDSRLECGVLSGLFLFIVVGGISYRIARMKVVQFLFAK